MQFPLLINGSEISRSTFDGSSTFYEQYHYSIAELSLLDISNAIGCARKAGRSALSSRIESLERAAQAFQYNDKDLEHAVCMTGMPISAMKEAFEHIPTLLRDVPHAMAARFTRSGGAGAADLEALGGGLLRMRVPDAGFCYAITPGIDPRAAAIVAANLGYLGIPFVLRASTRDAAAHLVICALIEGGFDPNFCSLVYLSRDDPQFSQKHFKLVDACSIVWTFGPRENIDPVIRYETRQQAILDLGGLDLEQATLESIQDALAAQSPAEFSRRIQVRAEPIDHFQGKTVVRHETGNCAAITYGPMDAAMQEALSAGLRYPILCTSTKSVLSVAGTDWIESARDFMAGLVTGDPLEPGTQVGYIQPRDLDSLSSLVKTNGNSIQVYGGRRISKHQAEPLLVASQADAPDFFAREIPAYVLAVRTCESLEEAVRLINAHSGERPRLAVTFLNLPESRRSTAILHVHAHALLFDRPTSTLLPAFHEGNDYAIGLTHGRLLVL